EVRIQFEPGLRILRLQALDHIRIEIALTLNAFIGQQVVDPLNVLPQQVRAAGRTKAKLFALDYLVRYQIFVHFFEDVLFAETVELQLRRDGAGKLNEINIQKRITPFDGVSEHHSVPVFGEQVV